MVLINHSCFTALCNNSVLYLSKFGNLHAYSILPKPKATPLVPWNGRDICSVCKTIRFLTTFHKDDVLLLLWRWDEFQAWSQMRFDSVGPGSVIAVVWGTLNCCLLCPQTSAGTQMWWAKLEKNSDTVDKCPEVTVWRSRSSILVYLPG